MRGNMDKHSRRRIIKYNQIGWIKQKDMRLSRRDIHKWKHTSESLEEDAEEHFDHQRVFDVGGGDVLHDHRNESTIQLEQILWRQGLSIASGLVANLSVIIRLISSQLDNVQAYLVRVEADSQANLGETRLVQLIELTDQRHAKGIGHRSGQLAGVDQFRSTRTKMLVHVQQANLSR